MDNTNPQEKHESLKEFLTWLGFVLGWFVLTFVALELLRSGIWWGTLSAMYISGWIGAAIGKRRGAPGIGFLMSFFVPVIGWIIACFLPKDESKTKA